MAEAAKGAGLVFFCNPNNPTGTAHNFAAVDQFVRRVKRESPDTAILIDEAYIDYTYDPAVKTAIPLAATTVVVPDSVPPPGLVPIAMVMLAVELVTVSLNASCTVTCTDGEMAAPAMAFAGWTVKASLAAAAGLMLNPVDPAPVNGVDDAVSE